MIGGNIHISTSSVSKARLAVLLLLVVSAVRLPAAEAFDLTTEFQRLPLGIDCPAPRFSWKMGASTNALGQPVRGQAQTAYRILVASTPDKLAMLSESLLSVSCGRSSG